MLGAATSHANGQWRRECRPWAGREAGSYPPSPRRFGVGPGVPRRAGGKPGGAEHLRSAAAAQRQVNNLIAAGMTEARGVAGIDARAIGYSVDPSDDKRTTWTAQQMLEMRGHDGPSLLDLTGRLQERGFATASLDWQLSNAARRKAHDAVTIEALKRLQQRAWRRPRRPRPRPRTSPPTSLRTCCCDRNHKSVPESRSPSMA